jgi:hypothetical protein
MGVHEKRIDSEGNYPPLTGLERELAQKLDTIITILLRMEARQLSAPWPGQQHAIAGESHESAVPL